MPNVCVTFLWKIGHTIFMDWYAAAVVVANFLFMRLSTGLHQDGPFLPTVQIPAFPGYSLQ
jgi:hypothetical protein